MNAYINNIGLSRPSVQHATSYVGDEAHKNHKLHTIEGPMPLGAQTLGETLDEIFGRGDRFNNEGHGRAREIYASWHVFSIPVGVFPGIEDLTQLGKAGGNTLASDGCGYLAIHLNKHSGAADINWIVSRFHYAPLLRARRNRRLNEEALLRNALNAKSEKINAARSACGFPLIPLLRPPTSNNLEAKVAALVSRSGLTVNGSSLLALLAALGVKATIGAGLLNVLKTNTAHTTFTTPVDTFVHEVERLLSRPKKAFQRPCLKEGASTLLNEWKQCAMNPEKPRATGQFEPKM